MSDRRDIEPVRQPRAQVQQLNAELAAERERLREAEAALAAEQAAVNAFRMHCRLTIGDWVETVLALRAEREGCITQLRLLRQALEREEPAAAANEDASETAAHDPLLDRIIADWEDTAAQRAAEKRLYRELARRFHPDLAATTVERAYRTNMMAAVNVAYQRHDVGTLRDLAGELDPALVAALDTSATDQIRRLREQILKCRRRQRKVAQQLETLRQEHTAQLWRKAQEIDVADDGNWWQEVAHSLAVLGDQLRLEIATLREETDRLEAQPAAIEEEE